MDGNTDGDGTDSGDAIGDGDGADGGDATGDGGGATDRDVAIAIAGQRPARDFVQEATTVVVSIIALTTVTPRGWTGTGLLVVALTIVNVALLASRHLRDTVVTTPVRIGLLYAGAAAAAALLVVAHAGVVAAFPFFVAGHAGFRLATRPAVAVAVTCSALCGGVLLIHGDPGGHVTPWYVGAASGASVLLGMVNRANDSSVAARLAAAASGERAARAEAREQVLAERARIARDVHDALAHSLAGITVQLDLSAALLERGDVERARLATVRAQSLVRGGLQEVQRTVQALRDDALPLIPTLQSMFASVPARLVVTGTPRDTTVQTSQALIRAAQEAVTNARKYAPHAPIDAGLQFADDAVSVRVHNAPPASGQRPLADAGGGMGLVGMRERLALAGGSVQAGPSDDGGWNVLATVPTVPG